MNAGIVLIHEQHDRRVGGNDPDPLQRITVGTRHVHQHHIRSQRGHRVASSSPGTSRRIVRLASADSTLIKAPARAVSSSASRILTPGVRLVAG